MLRCHVTCVVSEAPPPSLICVVPPADTSTRHLALNEGILAIALVSGGIKGHAVADAVAGTVVVHEQIAEADYLRGMGEFYDFPAFTITARESLPFYRSLFCALHAHLLVFPLVA